MTNQCEVKGVISLSVHGEKWHTHYYSGYDKLQAAIERLAKKNGLGGPFGPRYNLALVDREGNYCGGGSLVI